MAISEREKELIAQLCESIGKLQTTVLTRRACQIAEYLHELETGELAEQDEDEIGRRMTAAMREADRTFERVGGSTRHHIRDCLMPILAKHGLKLVAISPVAVGQESQK